MFRCTGVSSSSEEIPSLEPITGKTKFYGLSGLCIGMSRRQQYPYAGASKLLTLRQELRGISVIQRFFSRRSSRRAYHAFWKWFAPIFLSRLDCEASSHISGWDFPLNPPSLLDRMPASILSIPDRRVTLQKLSSFWTRDGWWQRLGLRSRKRSLDVIMGRNILGRLHH